MMFILETGADGKHGEYPTSSDFFIITIELMGINGNVAFREHSRHLNMMRIKRIGK